MAEYSTPSSSVSGSADEDPSHKSSDYEASEPFWKMVCDVLGGAETMRATRAGGYVGGQPIQVQNVPSNQFNSRLGAEQAESPYLPKFPNEDFYDYERRRCNAFFTNVYGDIVANLSSKPFSKPCKLAEGSNADLVKYSEDIDGLGNNLHIFAGDVFNQALNKAITWIMVDYTKVPVDSTLEQERKMGARPYWVHIHPEKMLAVYSKFLNGKEIIFHARIDECTTELNGYEEKHVNRVRVLDRDPTYDENGNIIGFGPTYWYLWEEEVEEVGADKKKVSRWSVIDAGEISIGIIPLVPVILGKRKGTSWKIEPPLRDLVYMQIKLFQMESNLDSIKELAAFPMLAGNGIAGETKDTAGATVKIKVPVGPRSVLFAPPDGTGGHGNWGFIEPQGSSLTFLQQEIEKHKTEMRDLGMQPLSAANLTVVTTANLSQKASSACQAWALALKDALEQAWVITTMWLKQAAAPEVIVFTDFAIKVDGTDLAEIAKADNDGVISKKLRFTEMQRRGVINADASWEDDQKELATQQKNDVLTPEVHIDPVTGQPVAVTPKHGTLNPPPKQPIKLKPGEKVVSH